MLLATVARGRYVDFGLGRPPSPPCPAPPHPAPPIRQHSDYRAQLHREGLQKRWRAASVECSPATLVCDVSA
ncbi:MAG: hypothetical protein ACK559_18525, partial [bacterium]